MSKLSLEALKLRAESIATEELLASINGGTANACHNQQTELEKKIQQELLDLMKKPCTGNA